MPKDIREKVNQQKQAQAIEEEKQERDRCWRCNQVTWKGRFCGHPDCE